MHTIVALRYIDAFYSMEQSRAIEKFVHHHVVGNVVSVTNNAVSLCFTERDGAPWSGLVLPNEAIIFDDDPKTSPSVSLQTQPRTTHGGQRVIVTWKDVVYFDHGMLPSLYSMMRTSGTLFSETENILIIKDPITKNARAGKTVRDSLATDQSRFLTIPKQFVIDITTV